MPQSNQFQSIVTTNLVVTMLNGQANTAAIDLSGTTLSAIEVPAAFAGSALSLQAATSKDGTYYDVVDSAGDLLAIAASASKIITIEPAKTASLQYIKLVSDTVQTADVELTLLSRPL